MEVPTLDLSRLRGDDIDRAALAEEFRACCHEGLGFFYLLGHGIDQEMIDAVFDLAKRAFMLPQATKNLLDKRASPHFRGYETVGSEKTLGRPDWREQFDTWSECAATDTDGPLYWRLVGPNQFFDESILPCGLDRRWAVPRLHARVNGGPAQTRL